MRIRRVESNCSLTITFEEFKEQFVDCEELIFSENYEQVSIIGLPMGSVEDV